MANYNVLTNMVGNRYTIKLAITYDIKRLYEYYYLVDYMLSLLETRAALNKVKFKIFLSLLYIITHAETQSSSVLELISYTAGER